MNASDPGTGGRLSIAGTPPRTPEAPSHRPPARVGEPIGDPRQDRSGDRRRPVASDLAGGPDQLLLGVGPRAPPLDGSHAVRVLDPCRLVRSGRGLSDPPGDHAEVSRFPLEILGGGRRPRRSGGSRPTPTSRGRFREYSRPACAVCRIFRSWYRVRAAPSRSRWGSALATMRVHLRFRGEVMVVVYRGAQYPYGLPRRSYRIGSTG